MLRPRGNADQSSRVPPAREGHPALRQPSRASAESCSDKRAAQESQLAARGNGPQTGHRPRCWRPGRSGAPPTCLSSPGSALALFQFFQNTVCSLRTPYPPPSVLFAWKCFSLPSSPSSLYSYFNPYRRPLFLQEGLSELSLLRRLSASPRQPSLDVCVFHRLASSLACPLGEGRALVLGPGTVSGSSCPLHEH